MKRKLTILYGFVVIVVLVWGSIVCANAVKIFYSDGVIQQGESYDRVEVYDTPPLHTTVDMTGGYVGRPLDVDTGMYTYDASTVNISGGFADFLHTYDSSIVNVSGGVVGNLVSLGERTITSHNSSTINVYEGGLLSGWSSSYFFMFDSSTLNVYGGDVDLFLIAFHPSVVINIYDGSLFNVELCGTANIYGGSIGGAWPSYFDSTAVNIYGSDFVYEPHWYKTPPDDPIRGEQWVSRLTGMGLYGVPISVIDLPDPATNPNIHLIPEAGTILLLGLGVLGVLRDRRSRKITKYNKEVKYIEKNTYYVDGLTSTGRS
jgi:hypothetical protein